MALLLSEADVKSVLTMRLALEAVEDSFLRLADRRAILHSRQRLHVPGKTILNYMAAADGASGYIGLKIYTIARGVARFLVLLYGVESGQLVALIEADYLGQMRTGAASGVATRLMARQDARIAAIIGTGLQARTQLEAVAAVRDLEGIRAFGRDMERRERFATEMSSRLGVDVKPVASAEEAVRGAGILITSTTSKDPVLEGRWLEPGMHINAIGVNQAQKREIDAEAVGRCDLIAADSREQSKIEAGDLIQAFRGDESRWDGVYEFSDIVAGKIPGRQNRNQITLYKSNGIAIQDVTVAGRIYELARQRGLGREISTWGDEALAAGGRGV